MRSVVFFSGILGLALALGCSRAAVRAPSSVADAPSVSEVNELLPARMKRALGRGVEVRYAKLGSTEHSHILARTASRPPKAGEPFQVELDESLRGAPRRLVQKALIHELAHLYDGLNLRPESEIQELRQCEAMQLGNRNPFQEARCRELRALQGTVSDREPYRSMAKLRNSSRARSADSYEFKDVYEHFAVNFEFFLLDPEFACRRPALHQLFSEHFSLEPFPDRRCAVNTEVRLALSGLPVRIDPARVYQIHYLLAGRGEKLASRWGHAMFRIVLCAPERKEVGPECLKDSVHHIVLSYRANVYDLVLDYLASLTGKYPVQLFFYRLPEIVDEYTRTELRELDSVPLELSPSERRLFVLNALEQYWGYVGQYYFVTNNCATEARDFLKSITAGASPIQESAALTPKGLLKDLRGSGLLREGRSGAGFHFGSQKRSLDEAFGRIKGSPLGRELGTLEDYLQRTGARERRKLIEKVDERALAASFYLLERQIQRRHQRVIEEDVVKVLSETKKATGLEKARELQQKLLPANRIRPGAGYGIPLEDELIPDSEIEAIQEEIRSVMVGVREEMRELLGERMREASGISGNLKALLEKTGAGSDH